MTTYDATERGLAHPSRASIAIARLTRRRDEIEAIGLVLGILSILLVVVTAVGAGPGS